MQHFKTVRLRIPLDVFARVDRVAPPRQKGLSRTDFYSQVFLEGFDHGRRFLELENERNVITLDIENLLSMRPRPKATAADVERMVKRCWRAKYGVFEPPAEAATGAGRTAGALAASERATDGRT